MYVDINSHRPMLKKEENKITHNMNFHMYDTLHNSINCMNLQQKLNVLGL